MFEYQPPTNLFDTFMAPLQRQQQLNTNQQLADAQTQETKLNTAMLGMKVAEAQRQQALQQQYQSDVQSVISNPTPDALRALMLKYPDQHEALQQSYNNLTEGQKTDTVNAAASVYAALSNDRPDIALQLLQDRKTALSSAGQDTKVDDALIGMLQSGDPAQAQKAKGIAGYVLASATGPDKITDTLNALNGLDKSFTLEPGQYRYDSNGNLVAVGGAAKNDGSETASATPADPASAVSHTIGLEGGYNPKDANGSPTNWGINFAANKDILAKMGITQANFRQMTKDQAAQVYLQKYWPQSGAANLPANLQAPYFDVFIRNGNIAKAALAKSGGDPVKFVEISNQMFAPFLKKHPQYASSYQQRFDSNLAIANGTAPTGDSSQADSGQPAAPAGFHWLTNGNNSQFRVLSDAEVKQRGLDPGQQYQLDTKTGKVTGLGQKTGGGDVLGQYGIAPGETGPSVLAKIPASLASQVKALAEGRLPMPSSFALAKPYWQTLLQLTSQYDPTFDAASAPARKAAITAFTGNGKAAQTIGSVNRVANHLQLLWNESQKLAGPNLHNSALNSFAATVGQSFEPEDAKAYDTEVQFIAGELEKIARNSPGTVSGVNEIINNLSRKQSASTRAAAIKAAVGIISGAIDPLKDQYNSAFTNGSARPNIPWVSPKAQQIYRNIAGVDTSLTGANADTNATGGNTTTTGVKWRIVQ